VTVGRSQKEFKEPHGRKISHELHLCSTETDIRGPTPELAGQDKIFEVNGKSYGALIGRREDGRKASFYLHAEVSHRLAVTECSQPQLLG